MFDAITNSLQAAETETPVVSTEALQATTEDLNDNRQAQELAAGLCGMGPRKVEPAVIVKQTETGHMDIYVYLCGYISNIDELVLFLETLTEDDVIHFVVAGPDCPQLKLYTLINQIKHCKAKTITRFVTGNAAHALIALTTDECDVTSLSTLICALNACDMGGTTVDIGSASGVLTEDEGLIYGALVAEGLLTPEEATEITKNQLVKCIHGEEIVKRFAAVHAVTQNDSTEPTEPTEPTE